MELNDVLKVFKEKVGKKVIAYEDKGNSFILITDSNNKYDDSYYEVTPNDVRVTNPVISDLNEDKIVKINDK